jgi:uncharacterized protein YjgD (DUF1641 family)
MDATVLELNQKIDLLTAQVGYLTEQAQINERQRNERSELMRDITPLANQAFTLAVEQLEEVQEYIDLGDLMRLFKRLLRNGRNLEKMLDQLESLTDLLETVGPLADDAFGKVVELMAGLEARGYFTFARGGAHLMDQLVASFSEEDLIHLGDSLPQIAGLVKEIAQPDVVDIAQVTLLEAKQEIVKPINTSTVALIRQLNDPDVRRGLALTLRLLQVIGAQAVKSSPPAEHVINKRHNGSS